MLSHKIEAPSCICKGLILFQNCQVIFPQVKQRKRFRGPIRAVHLLSGDGAQFSFDMFLFTQLLIIAGYEKLHHRLISFRITRSL